MAGLIAQDRNRPRLEALHSLANENQELLRGKR